MFYNTTENISCIFRLVTTQTKAKRYLKKINKSQKILFKIFCLLFISGCSLAPEYQQPQLPVPKQVDYSFSSKVKSNSEININPDLAFIDAGWRTFFKDKRLQKLIEIALQNNRDLKSALLKVQESRTQFGVTTADRFPQVGVAGSGSYSGTENSPVTRSFSAQASISSFEIDLFGKLKSQSTSAFENYLSTAEAQKASQILLVSQTAQAYLNQRLAEEQLNLAKKTLSSRKSSLAFIQQRVQSGQSTLLELEQARSLVESASTSEASTRRALALAENALKFILGTYSLPKNILALSLENQSFTTLPSNILSSALLKRPDIMQAEHALKSANANIGAARAAFFPSITLTGSTGYSGSELDYLFAGVNSLWSFVPKITLPIFTGGKNVSNLQLAEIRKEESVVAYEKTIQTAFKEVADALASRPLLAEQIVAQRRYLRSQRTVLGLAENRYAGGVISYLEVLDAQRGVFQAEQELLELRRDQLINGVNLYTALGGGLREGESSNSKK